MADWRAVVKRMDRAVDDFFGDPFTLVPWVKKDLGAGTPDPTRTPLEGVLAIETRPRSANVGAAAGQASKTVEADVVLLMRIEPIEQVGLRKGDRVEAELRGEVYEVTLVEPTVTDRPFVHLVRIRE